MDASSGGKGTMRRKIVRKTKPSTAQDDKKLQGALKKLNVQPIPGVEEVNMFREDGNVLHFSTPKGTFRIIVYMSLRIFPSNIMSVPCVERCADRCGGMLRPRFTVTYPHALH